MKSISQLIAVLLLACNCFGTANFVYHEKTMNSPGGTCGTYVSSLNPTYLQTFSIEFGIDYQYFTNRAQIYYTTNGSNPSGSFGVPSGATQVISAAYFCSYNNGSGMVDVAKGTIPALPFGTVVKYIVSAWHSGGGLEIFGSSGTNTSSATATVFSYTVTAPLPLNLISFSGRKVNNSVSLLWITAQENNVDHYEIYHSSDGIQFEKTGTKNAVGNTSLTTTYTADDNNAVKGNNFYKIKCVDRDGRFTYTPVIKIIFSEKNIASIYQTGNVLQVTVSSTEKENYTIRLINNAGQIIKSDNFIQSSANEKHLLTLPAGIMKGIYHIALYSTHNFFKQSIFIQ